MHWFYTPAKRERYLHDLPIFRDRLTAGRQFLVLPIQVRILFPDPNYFKIMLPSTSGQVTTLSRSQRRFESVWEYQILAA
jgi:hypothetical protein